MAVSFSILAVVISLHLLAFVFAFGAERRRSTAVVVPDLYDEKTFCMYGTTASTVYGMSAFGLLLVSQTVVNGVTKCLCFGKGLVTGTSYTVWSIVFFVISWVSFLGAEACLLAGSVKNAYHTKSEGIYKGKELSCAVLPVGVFAAGAALTLLSLIATILYYLAHSKADTGGWEKHQNDGISMASPADAPKQQNTEFDKV
ncbi:hypothetical protein AALP_AA2G103100 [Arabis alpina]|uniref:Fiber protein fb34 n=1 Tax=Arabis alpina TaxID=50452 RepID=A0A087HGI1_ARAAL|nr:hypothetical protein AALP_AA2G103100 [Arabis alpina]